MKTNPAAPSSSLPSFPKAWPTGRLDRTKHQDILENIQGGILRPAARDFGCLVFFQFGGDEQKNRAALKVASGLTTSAYAQKEASIAFKAALLEWQKKLEAQNFFLVDGAVVIPAELKLPEGETVVSTFALSAAGFAQCGCGADLPKSTNGAVDENFAKGMADPSILASTKDPDPASWQAPFDQPGPMHGVWILSSSSRQTLKDTVDTVKKWIASCDGRMMGVPQECGVWRPGQKPFGSFKRLPPREPFGFVDGISISRFIEGDSKNHPSIELPLSQVLITDDSNHRGGSFLVVRRLEQNVDAFRKFEAAMCNLDGSPLDAATKEQYIVGRDREGQPMASGWKKGQDLNDFDFNSSRTGGRCPFDVHIRKPNARVANRDEPWPDLGAQIVRRSLVYGLDKLTMTPPWPTGGVGLWFMAFMRDFNGQFMTLHKDWLRSDDHPRSPPDSSEKRFSDLFIYGGRATETQSDPHTKIDWQWQGAACSAFADFVTFRGGEFFFAPSRCWLAAGGY